MNKTVEMCPICGTEIPVNDGYTTWCDKCNWNIDPHNRNKGKNLANKFYDAIGKKSTLSLFKTLKKETNVYSGAAITRIAAYILATLVHISGILAAYLAYKSFMHINPIVTLFLVVIAVCARPRFFRNKNIPLSRDKFPSLFKFVDEIAQELNANNVDEIIVNGDFNASFSHSHLKKGFQAKYILTIGLPLFYILTPQEKIALIGHEMAHNANNDTIRGFYIGSALRTLSNWYNLLAPPKDDMGLSGIVRFLFIIPRLIIYLLWSLLGLLVWRNSQICEYYADRSAATLSGSDSFISMLKKIHFGNIFISTFKRVFNYRFINNFFTEFESRIKNMPEREIERIERLEKIALSRVDSSHPPTYYRIQYVKELPIQNPKYIVSDEFMNMISKELESEYQRVNKSIIEFYKNVY